MHRSRLCQVVIDCDNFDADIEFWSRALGTKPHNVGERYAGLRDGDVGLTVLLQRVPEPKTAKSRVHLDFETDDVEAEVRRLEALGAQRTEQCGEWCVMLDPCGNEFCVLPVQSDDFTERARVR